MTALLAYGNHILSCEKYIFSLNRPSGPIQSISQNVRRSVCLSPFVRYRLIVFLPPLTKVQGQLDLDLDFWIPWGKVLERSGLRFEFFCSKMD